MLWADLRLIGCTMLTMPLALPVALFVQPFLYLLLIIYFSCWVLVGAECINQWPLEWMHPSVLCDSVQGPTFGRERKFDWTPDAADVTSPRINWFLPSPHQNSTAPMPGLMVSLEFRLHPVAFAVRVIGHRRHVWFLSMEREPDPMSLHWSWASPRPCFASSAMSHMALRWCAHLGACVPGQRGGFHLQVLKATHGAWTVWVGLKPSPSGFSWALLFS